MKRLTTLLFSLLAVVSLQTYALDLVKKWELDGTAVGLSPGFIANLYLDTIGKDYSVVLSYNGNEFWISGTGQLIMQLPPKPAKVFFVSSSNLVLGFHITPPPAPQESNSFGVFRQINGLVVSNEFSVPGKLFTQLSSGFDGKPLSTTKQPDLLPLITYDGSKVACYILDAPEIFPKPSVTSPILKPTSATITVTNPSDGLVALESSTNLVGWTVVAHLAPSPTPTPVSVPLTNQPALFLRAREE